MARSRSPKSKPGLATEGVELVHDAPALALEAPTEFLIVETGQRVHDRVEVGADRETVHREVVADVDDRGELVRIDGVANASSNRAAPTPPLRTVITFETLRGRG